MYLYSIITAGIFLSSFLCEGVVLKKRMPRKWANTLYTFWILLLILLSAFRYGIGRDYNTYYNIYINAKSSAEHINLVSLVIVFLRYCNLPYQIAIVLCSLCFLVPVSRIIKIVNDQYKLLSLAILMGFSFYVYSYNIFRQYAAIGLVLWFLYRWVLTHNKKYVFFLIIPVLIHASSIVAVFVYFIVFIKQPSYRAMRLLSYLGCLLFLVVPASVTEAFVRFVISLFRNTLYGGYAATTDTHFLARIYSQSMEFIPKVLFFPAMYALPLLEKRLKENELVEIPKQQYHWKIKQAIIAVYYVYFLIMSMKFGSEIVSRFLMYFSILSVWAIPMALAYLKNCDVQRWIKQLVVLAIFVISMYYQITWAQVNACEAYPYQSVFFMN